MNIVLEQQRQASAVAVMVYQGDKTPLGCDEALSSLAAALRPNSGLKEGKRGFRLVPLASVTDSQLVLLELSADVKNLGAEVRNSCSSLVRSLRDAKIGALQFYFPFELNDELTQATVEGVVLGSYSFTKYLTMKPQEPGVADIYLAGTEEGLRKGTIIAKAQLTSRKVTNEPGNVIGPDNMCAIAEEICERGGLECKTFDDSEIRKMGMEALWAVGKGSSRKPRLAHMIYRPRGEAAKKKVVFVGKSVTFDSGGLSIKPSDSMVTMKQDKMGACNVLGIMEAVAALRPNVEVHGIFGAAENMPDGDAYRVDDIIKARNGKTIEVKNTDAEGRVTLADTLDYASEQNPDVIIDMATLTGAISVALGSYTAGAMGDDEDLAYHFIEAGKACGERFHFFPLDDEKLREQIDSPCADLLNSGGRPGGSLTAAMFLREFVRPGIAWLHLDVAGVDRYEKEFDCYGVGATGYAVRTCLQWLLSL